jgi:hypothetical protein
MKSEWIEQEVNGNKSESQSEKDSASQDSGAIHVSLESFEIEIED